MIEYLFKQFIKLLQEIQTLDSSITLLVVLIVISVIVIDSLLARVQEVGSKTGVDLSKNASKAFRVEGDKKLAVKDYISDIQGLAGRPDALLVENSYIIPVEHKPLANKLRDRHIAQLLVYMRLIEEFEGKRPPYGYLILGSNARKIKVSNSREKQAWLQKLLDSMREHLEKGEPVIATPQSTKCNKCAVSSACTKKTIPAESSVNQ
jgi:CRISPR/Cas system-associated exonuclease Cas4 (RecB family)